MKLPRQLILATGLAAFVLIVNGGRGTAQEMPIHPEPGATVPSVPILQGGGRSAREIPILPRNKRALRLKADERNPYARRTSELAIEENDPGEETESDRIRKVLKGLAVSGRTYGARGIRLLVGDIIFESGKPVPPVLEDQTEILMVENVTEEFVTIDWIDPDTGGKTGQRLTLTYDLSPKVGYVLPGQRSGAEKNKPKFGVMRRSPRPEREPGERNRNGRIGSAASGLPNEISPEVFKQGQ